MKKLIVLIALIALCISCNEKPEKEEYVILHPTWRDDLSIEQYLFKTDSVLADLTYRINTITSETPPEKIRNVILVPGWAEGVPQDKIIEHFAIKTDSVLAQLKYQIQWLQYKYSINE